MASVQFRDYLPYYKSAIDTPSIVTDDEPTYTAVNTLIITAVLPAGDYRVGINFQWHMPDINDSGIFRVVSPVTSGSSVRIEPKDLSDVDAISITVPVVFAGGPITIALEVSKTSGAANLTVDSSSIEFERVK